MLGGFVEIWEVLMWFWVVLGFECGFFSPSVFGVLWVVFKGFGGICEIPDFSVGGLMELWVVVYGVWVVFRLWHFF